MADRVSSDRELPIMSPSAADVDEPFQSFSYLYTAKAIWQPAASVCSVYTITLAIFPGFLAEDVSSQQLGSWYPVLLITAFNIADVIGKTLPVQARFAMQNKNWMLNLCLARILFLPAFYVAASQGFGPSVMSVLTLALGVTNGYLTAVSMMVAPAGLQVSDGLSSHVVTCWECCKQHWHEGYLLCLKGYEHALLPMFTMLPRVIVDNGIALLQGQHAHMAGNIMAFFLVSGCSLGAAAGFLWLL